MGWPRALTGVIQGASVRVIAKRNLVEAARAHSDCVSQVEKWYRVASKATWSSLADVRQIFPHADLVGDKTVFNIKGNDYRLIVHINYTLQIILYKHLLTHAEYDQAAWR
jgi:mRNA interferase HigB